MRFPGLRFAAPENDACNARSLIHNHYNLNLSDLADWITEWPATYGPSEDGGNAAQRPLNASPAEASMTTYPDLKLYIGGAWRKTAEEQPVINPADESVIGAVPLASQSDLDDALTAAAEGCRRGPVARSCSRPPR